MLVRRQMRAAPPVVGGGDECLRACRVACGHGSGHRRGGSKRSLRPRGGLRGIGCPPTYPHRCRPTVVARRYPQQAITQRVATPRVGDAVKRKPVCPASSGRADQMPSWPPPTPTAVTTAAFTEAATCAPENYRRKSGTVHGDALPMTPAADAVAALPQCCRQQCVAGECSEQPWRGLA